MGFVQMNMRDQRCDTVYNATLTMAEEEANLWFCQHSEEAKGVFRDEYSFATHYRGSISGSLNPTHKLRCKKYMKQHWKKSMNRRDIVAFAKLQLS